MSYKILEENGIDNENVDGAAFNRFAAGGRDGIIRGVLSECALTSLGNGVGIAPGLILMCGIRVKIIDAETLFLSSAPLTATQWQIIVQATLQRDRSLAVSFLLRTSGGLRQDALYAAESGVYEVKLGSLVHNPDGSISGLTQTLDIITGGGAGTTALEVGNVTTETLAPGMDAALDVTLRTDEQTGKTLLDFTAEIPQGASGVDAEAVHFTPQDLTAQQKAQARQNIGALSSDDIPKGSSTPLMDGIGNVGVENAYAPIDHVHPSDTSKANAVDLANEITARESSDSALSSRIDSNDNAISALQSDKVNKSGDTMTGELIVPSLQISKQSAIEIGAEAITPHIDFHYNNDPVDYTARIIEDPKGALDIRPILNENGQRVYSPNNKPTLNALGIRYGAQSFNGTSITINHGLGRTPSAISVTIQSPNNNGTNYYVTSRNSTNFTVSVYSSSTGGAEARNGMILWIVM